MFDLVVGASSIYGGSWLEGAGAVYAENAALRWVADLAGLPPDGRWGLRARRHDRQPVGPRDRPRVGAGPPRRDRLAEPAADQGGGAAPARTPRSQSACEVMDAELVGVEVDADQRLTGPALRKVLEADGPDTFFAVVATCGTTNFGIVDDLASVAEVCREFGIWFHVDGAYGGAGLAAPSVRHLYAGIEHCRLLHRRPAQVAVRAVRLLRPALPRAGPGAGGAHPARLLPRRPHRRPRLEPHRLLGRPDPAGPWPAVLVLPGHARHATPTPSRDRADAGGDPLRGGGDRAAALRRGAARAGPVGRRLPPDRLDRRRTTRSGRTGCWPTQFAFVVPTSHEGETVTRFAIVNPSTTEDDITRHPRHDGLTRACRAAAA